MMHGRSLATTAFDSCAELTGVKRGTVRVPQSADQLALEGVVKSLDFVQRQVGAKTVKRVVVVPGRLVNVVV